jgi:hypothetical protein
LSGAVPICRLPYAVDSLPYAREFGLIRDQDDQCANSAAGSDTTIAIFSLIGRTFGRNKIPRLALIVLQVGFAQLEVAQRLARWHPRGPCVYTAEQRRQIAWFQRLEVDQPGLVERADERLRIGRLYRGWTRRAALATPRAN